MVAIGKNRAVALCLLVAAIVSAAPTAWWLAAMGPTILRGASDDVGRTALYLGLNGMFLIIPVVAIVRAQSLIQLPRGEMENKSSPLAEWLWVLLLLNPLVYIFWLMFSMAGM